MNETKNVFSISNIYSITILISGIIVGFFAILTVLGNGFLLVAIWKDPYKAFRVPPTVFVIGLAVADLLTGAVVAPLFTHSRISSYLNENYSRCCILDRTLLSTKTSRSLSLMTMNASYLVLLFLTWSQFTAIRFPHKNRVFITTKKVSFCVISVWIYAVFFSSLSFLVINEEMMNKLDFYMHTLVFIVLLIVAYCCLYFAYKTQVNQIVAATTQRSTETQRRESNRIRRRSEKQFTIVTMVLVMFIILFTLPSTVLQFITVYCENRTCKEDFKYLIAREISTDVLFLKFALDPFVYCWRLITYRKALWSLIPCLKTPAKQHVFAVSMRTAMPGSRKELNDI